MPLPLWAGMALAAAATGAAKSEFIDKPRTESMNKAQAAATAYSPWTGMKGNLTAPPSSADAALKWGAAGAMLGAGMPAGAGAAGAAGAGAAGAGAGAGGAGMSAAGGASAAGGMGNSAMLGTGMAGMSQMDWNNMKNANQMSPASRNAMMGSTNYTGAQDNYGYGNYTNQAPF